MRRHLLDLEDMSYGIRLGPLDTPGKAAGLWARNLLPLTAIALVPAMAQLLIEALALALSGEGLEPSEETLYAATGAAGLLTFPLAYGATAASFLLLDSRVRIVERQVGVVRFYGRGLKLFGRLFGIFFLMGLALMAPLVPAFVLWKLDLHWLAIPAAVIAGGFDVWLLVRWSVAAPAAAIEGVTFSVAFDRSKRLVSGSWWIAFAALFPFAAASGLVVLLLSLLEADGVAVQLGNNLVTNIVLSPPLDCAVFTLYAALRDRELSREGDARPSPISSSD